MFSKLTKLLNALTRYLFHWGRFSRPCRRWWRRGRACGCSCLAVARQTHVVRAPYRPVWSAEQTLSRESQTDLLNIHTQQLFSSLFNKMVKTICLKMPSIYNNYNIWFMFGPILTTPPLIGITVRTFRSNLPSIR